MSSATPIDSSVREVLLKTSAPGGINEATVLRALSPDRTTNARMPLCSRASATAAMRSGELTWENSATACSDKSGGIAVLLTADLRQPLMHKSNRHGTLSDSGRTALGGPSPDVAGRENAGKIRFEGKRWSRYVPTLRHLGERCQLTPSRNVTGIVDHESCPTDSICPRLAPDADEQGVGAQWLRRLALRGCDENFTELAVGLDADDLSPRPHVDIGYTCDGVDEVLRHRGGEVWPTYEERHPDRIA